MNKIQVRGYNHQRDYAEFRPIAERLRGMGFSNEAIRNHFIEVKRTMVKRQTIYGWVGADDPTHPNWRAAPVPPAPPASCPDPIPASVTISITEHEGNKYLRRIRPACPPWSDATGEHIMVDVYAVIEAFGVTCPARAHAIKKLLCAGQRGKGNTKADLVGAIAAINRAIELCDE